MPAGNGAFGAAEDRGAKAGKNDCETMTSSCAGTARRSGQPDAWVYLPKGSCEKVVGGVLKPKQG